MKEALILAGIGFAALQTIVLLAILAAAARPTPQFEPDLDSIAKPCERHEERELELV